MWSTFPTNLLNVVRFLRHNNLTSDLITAPLPGHTILTTGGNIITWWRLVVHKCFVRFGVDSTWNWSSTNHHHHRDPIDAKGKGCKFNPVWLTWPSYSKWLRAFKGDAEKAFCCQCNRAIDLRTMGESALKSHAKSNRHVNMMAIGSGNDSITSFLKTNSTTNTT